MGLGLITCGEGEDVSSVHTLLSGVVQVCHELLVGEGTERQEKKEVESGRVKVKRERSRGWHVDGVKGARLKLDPNVSVNEMCKREV